MSAEVRSVREYISQPILTIEWHKIMQVFVNLIRNASACNESNRTDKKMTMRITEDNDRTKIAMMDNGVGILAVNFADLSTVRHILELPADGKELLS